MFVLTLNVGSSSIKAALFDVVSDASVVSPRAPRWTAEAPWALGNDAATLRAILDAIPESVHAVGHRVVHGGHVMVEPTVIDSATLDVLRTLTDLAPAHLPGNICGIEAASAAFPLARHVAVFDTAFHSAMPPTAYTLSGPRVWLRNGIRRYGFHGISHDYVGQRTARLLERRAEDLRIVSCHLGNGCSLAAIQNGRSVDTTMGFTPLDGLVMGTRSGSIDPGVILHLLRNGATIDEIDRLLNHESGLLGMSGVSGDMRAVRSAADSGHESAKLAIGVFVHRLRGHIAAMAASMNGLDALVFTAGIGEHDARIRAETTSGLRFLGIAIDDAKNDLVAPDVDTDISAPGSAVRTLVVHTKENWAIACATARACG